MTARPATVKTNAPGYVKDTRTGLNINTNYNDYLNTVKERERSKEMQQLKNDLNQLKEVKTELLEIKTLLQKVLNNNG